MRAIHRRLKTWPMFIACAARGVGRPAVGEPLAAAVREAVVGPLPSLLGLAGDRGGGAAGGARQRGGAGAPHAGAYGCGRRSGRSPPGRLRPGRSATRGPPVTCDAGRKVRSASLGHFGAAGPAVATTPRPQRARSHEQR